MRSEVDFNTCAAAEFIAEFQRETGALYRFKRMGQPFPDVILEAPDGAEIGVEFVSVVLAFINQERSYFERYRRAFLKALQFRRPQYGRLKITLQPHSEHVGQGRPMRLPDVSGGQGRQLVADFVQLLSERFEQLSTVWRGNDGGALLDQLRNADGALCYPILSRHFGAILFHKLTAQEISATNARIDEPVIADPVICYSSAEVSIATQQALKVKVKKGAAYATELLVLHTLPKPDVADACEAAMHADEITRLGRLFLNSAPELRTRFAEIWFLNRYITEGKRLHRLA